jgi:hypothetical protein
MFIVIKICFFIIKAYYYHDKHMQNIFLIYRIFILRIDFQYITYQYLPYLGLKLCYPKKLLELHFI